MRETSSEPKREFLRTNSSERVRSTPIPRPRPRPACKDSRVPPPSRRTLTSVDPKTKIQRMTTAISNPLPRILFENSASLPAMTSTTSQAHWVKVLPDCKVPSETTSMVKPGRNGYIEHPTGGMGGKLSMTYPPQFDSPTVVGTSWLSCISLILGN